MLFDFTSSYWLQSWFSLFERGYKVAGQPIDLMYKMSYARWGALVVLFSAYLTPCMFRISLIVLFSHSFICFMICVAF